MNTFFHNLVFLIIGLALLLFLAPLGIYIMDNIKGEEYSSFVLGITGFVILIVGLVGGIIVIVMSIIAMCDEERFIEKF